MERERNMWMSPGRSGGKKEMEMVNTITVGMAQISRKTTDFLEAQRLGNVMQGK